MNEERLGAFRKRALMSLWQLVRLVDEDVDGMITGSAYATATVVARLLQQPRVLPDALARLGSNALARSQNGDGSWGSRHTPARYRVLPTLAAVSTLLGLPADAPVDRDRARAAARRGSEFLFADPEILAPERLPGLPGIDLTIPLLLERVAELPAFDRARFGAAAHRARTTQRANVERCTALRAGAVTGDRRACREFPLELLDVPPRGWARAVHDGAVACSPALTATAMRWHGAELPGAERYLRREGVRHQGLWPVLAPATNFERASAAALFVRLGLPLPPGVTASLSASVRSALGADGMSFAPGLPPDVDDTALAVFVLNSWDEAVDPGCLLGFPATSAPIAAAHVLEALSTVPCVGGAARAHTARVAAVRALIETQDADGHWDDGSVATPGVPTAAAAMALARAIESEFCADALLAVSRAIAWLLGNQRSDGSWGLWYSTAEETAYAVHALSICASPAVERPVAAALRRAHIFLADSFDSAVTDSVRTPLWHYRDLGSPLRIERLHTLTALLLSGSPVV